VRRGVGSMVTLWWATGAGNTYTHSVKEPRSQRERYMRAAPMDLRSQVRTNHLWKRRYSADVQDSDYSRSRRTCFGQGGKFGKYHIYLLLAGTMSI